MYKHENKKLNAGHGTVRKIIVVGLLEFGRYVRASVIASTSGGRTEFSALVDGKLQAEWSDD